MGLAFSHGDAHWAYSGFMRFRSRLAESLGYSETLHDMYNNGTYYCMENEAIWPLINHSDCDGVLSVEEMMQIIPQLQALINKWNTARDEFHQHQGQLFINGMQHAISANEPMIFN